MQDKILDQPISTADAVKLLQITASHLSLLATQGVIRRHVRGQWLLRHVVRDYFAHLQKIQARQTAASPVSAARAKQLELQNQRNDDELIEISAVTALVTNMLGIFKAEFEALPARCSDDADQRRTIAAHLDDIYGRAAKRGNKLGVLS